MIKKNLLILFILYLSLCDAADFIPKKTKTYPAGLSALTLSYYNKKFNVSFLEHKNNYEISFKEYTFRRFDSAKKFNKVNFVSVNIDENGHSEKRIIDENNTAHLFPWLNDNHQHKVHSFESRSFIPLEFLFN